MPIMLGRKLGLVSMFGLNTNCVKSKTLITDLSKDNNLQSPLLNVFDNHTSLVDIYRATQRKYYPEDDMYLKIKISQDKKENIL